MARSRPVSSRPAPEHEMTGGDPHLYRLGREGNVCNCMGPCCFDAITLDCTCGDCDCVALALGRKTRAAEVEAVQAAAPPEHACQDCGVEVFRKGTRGRYPLRCPRCKVQ